MKHSLNGTHLSDNKKSISNHFVPIQPTSFSWYECSCILSPHFSFLSCCLSVCPLALRLQTFPCGVDGCDRRFRSLRAFEEHYHSSHRFRCIQCGRTFGNKRLLDVHITETHDSFFFAVRKTRPMVCHPAD